MKSLGIRRRSKEFEAQLEIRLPRARRALAPHKVMRLMQNMPELWTHHHKIGATTTTHASVGGGRWGEGDGSWAGLVPSQISAIPDETRHNPIPSTSTPSIHWAPIIAMK